MATHSNILAWKTLRTAEEPDGLQSMGLKESAMTVHSTGYSAWSHGHSASAFTQMYLTPCLGRISASLTSATNSTQTGLQRT